MKTLVFDRTESNDFDRELANIEISLLEILDQKVSKSLQSTETIRVFDQLELKKFQKVYIYDKIKENVKITSINCLENGEYVISGTKGNNLLCLYVIDHHKCLASWREQLNRPFRHIMSCSLNSIIIKVYDHINFDTSIIVFDKRLKKQTSKVMAQTSCWLTSDDRFVYLLQLRPNIIIHFLTHQLDFHQDLRLNFEKKDFSIDDFFVNIKTYYLLDQHNGSILVGDMKTGNLVRKIRIEGAKIFTRSLISIQNELVVVILQFFEKIEKQYLAVIDIKKGEIVEKIELDFEKKVQQIVLKNKQFFSFIDLNRYIIYVAIEN